MDISEDSEVVCAHCLKKGQNCVVGRAVKAEVTAAKTVND